MTATSSKIHVGPWTEALSHIERLSGGARLPIVTDANVWSIHGDEIVQSLPVDPICVASGEDAKDWSGLQSVIAKLAEANHPRSLPIMAFGGGSVGDLAGLAAALYRRGTPVIQIPTTLLAQVDSSVGGKTAIDAEGQKNLVGAFHFPALVIADPAFLRTLDMRQLRAGIAEVIKYGAIGDAGFFGRLGSLMPDLLAADPSVCALVVQTCVDAKLRIVEGDPSDLTGQRAHLNFGHTFGHAIESHTGLGTVLHGEAVAVGMVLAAAYSQRIAAVPEGTSDKIEDLLKLAGLPTAPVDVGIADSAALLDHMTRDKKNTATGQSLVLLRAIGEAFIDENVDIEELRRFLEEV